VATVFVVIRNDSTALQKNQFCRQTDVIYATFMRLRAPRKRRHRW